MPANVAGVLLRRALPVLLAVAAPTLAAVGCGSSPAHGPATTDVRSPPPGRQVAKGRPTPAPRVHVKPSHAAVPVLMYHVIAAAPAGARYAGLWVAPSALRAQVQALAGAGFTGVTLDNVLDAWEGRARLPAHPVVLSFDDGYLSQGKFAGEVLRAARWPGVLNLAWHNVGVAGGLSTSRVRTLIGDGWEIDAHTITHPDLTTLGAAALQREIAGSRARIRTAFGVPVDAFCYPAGRFDPAVEAAVRAAGFRAATTELTGAARPGGDRYALPRIRVDAGDSVPAVMGKVRAAVGSAA